MRIPIAIMLSLISFVLGFLLLSAPIRDPLSVKFAISEIDERPQQIAIETHRQPHPLKEDAEFLSTDRSWSELIESAKEQFGPPDFRYLTIPFPSGPEELLADVYRGRGDCSAWTEAIMLLCAAAGRPCREWANLAYPPPLHSGHSVVEFWLPDRNRWAILDIRMGFWVRDASGEPASVKDFVTALRAGQPLEMVPIRESLPPNKRLQWTYGNPNTTFVELVRNHPEQVFGHWTRHIEPYNVELAQLIQHIVGLSPLYLIENTETNADLKRGYSLLRLRLAGGSVAIAFGVAIGCAVILMRRREMQR